MPGFALGRDGRGWLRIRIQGCCGNIERWQLEYERAFLEQVLREGGHIEGSDDLSVVVVDRKARRHTLQAAACSRPPIGSPQPPTRQYDAGGEGTSRG